MTRPIPLLLVGYGVRGRQWHQEARRARFPVAGVVDPDPRARAAAGPLSHPSLPDALTRSVASAAIIASPSQEHAADAIACLRAGLAVMVEKPLALSSEEAHRVAEAAAATGRPAMVGQNFRYLAREVGIRRSLGAGDIGRPVAETIVSARSLPGAPQRAGGVLWDFVLQHLDTLRNRYGDSPASVAAEADGTEGEWLIRLDWADGPRVVYHHREGGPGYHFHERIEGPDGALVVSDQRVTLVPRGGRGRRVSTRGTRRPEQLLLERLAEAVETGQTRTGSLGINDNLGTVELIEAVARSAAERRSITFETRPTEQPVRP